MVLVCLEWINRITPGKKIQRKQNLNAIAMKNDCQIESIL